MEAFAICFLAVIMYVARSAAKISIFGRLLASPWKSQRSKTFVNAHKFLFREVSPSTELSSSLSHD